MKKLLLLLLLAFVSYSVVGEPTGPSKRCATCGQLITKCKYKGRHPKTNKKTANAKRNQDNNSKRKREANAMHKPEPDNQQRVNKRQEAKKQDEAQDKRQTNDQNSYEQKERVINGHEWVDLGLSVKWATCNVGADSPSDYGDYFAWGETAPKPSYEWYNCFDCLDSIGHCWGQYDRSYKFKQQIKPHSGLDAARENWGGPWRMPTEKEIKELKKKCKWNSTSKNGRYGYEVTGPNGNSIFLPAAGLLKGTSSYDVGSGGYYWSSTISTTLDYWGVGRCLLFLEGAPKVDNASRKNGLSVRPVMN